MKLYYAHHIWKYDTKIEEYELELIENNFPQYEIINPNKTVNQSLSESDIMTECFNCVDSCDVVVFSSMDGVVGKGVYEEVSRAVDDNNPVYYLYQNKFFSAFTFKIIENSNTNRIYATVNTDLDLYNYQKNMTKYVLKDLETYGGCSLCKHCDQAKYPAYDYCEFGGCNGGGEESKWEYRFPLSKQQ